MMGKSMSDIQSKIAARRALLLEQESGRQAQEDAAKKQLQIAVRKQEKTASEAIAADLSTSSTTVKFDGDSLYIANETMPYIDVAGLKKQQIDSLLNKEARKRWTVSENWVVIGCIVSGACLVLFSISSIVIVFVGFWKASSFNTKHRASVIEDYPHIFGPEIITDTPQTNEG
jgi:hypothetical protein